jgi:hypothetical protein
MELLEDLITVTTCIGIGFALLVVSWRLTGNRSQKVPLTVDHIHSTDEDIAPNSSSPQRRDA